jgi:hypothetical protein
MKKIICFSLITLVFAFNAYASEDIQGLVNKFSEKENYYTSSKYNEASVRVDFIDKLFELLGWDVTNSKQQFLYKQDSIPETRLKIGKHLKYADYGFKIDDKMIFYVEAKAAHEKLSNPKHIFQAKRYAWSGMNTEIAILTDFEEFRVFDARLRPDFNNPLGGEITSLRMTYKDYPKRLKELKDLFGKENVFNGSIRGFLAKTNPDLERVPMDKNFIEDLDKFRLQLGKNIYKNNPQLSIEDINFASHHILNQLVFTRILEDRNIEPTGRLRDVVFQWKEAKNDTSLYSNLKEEFKRLKKRFHGIIYGKHIANNLNIDNSILTNIINNLYPPVSPYDFSAMPMYVLGKAYENYLGRHLELNNNNELVIRLKPEVRKAGGVFYTPEWVTQYITDQTLTPKLKNLTASDLHKIKILDVACGSGAFTVTLASKLLESARTRYSNNPNEIKSKNSEFPNAYKTYNGEWKLSAKEKASLINDTIHCIDIDPLATEATIMWLYILILEDEGSSIITQERKYRVPNRVKPKRIETFKLPNLNENIIIANALVKDDFSKDIKELQRVKAFNWDTTKIKDIIKNGGFDVITSNPPYISTTDMRKFIPEQYDYFRKHYKSMEKSRPDLAYAFIEKGISLLKDNGNLGYITGNGFIYNESGKNLRHIIQEKGLLKQLIDFGVTPVFEDVNPATAITILHKGINPTFKYAKINNLPSVREFKHTIRATIAEKPDMYVREISQEDLNKKNWGFASPLNAAMMQFIMAQPKTLNNLAESFQGLVTGADKVFTVTLIKEDGEKALVYSKETEQEHWVEKNRLKRILRSRDIRRYKNLANNLWLIWTFNKDGRPIIENEFKNEFPLTYTYLELNKERLLKRNKNDMQRLTNWFDILIMKNRYLLPQPKILSGWKKGKPQYTLDKTGEFYFTGGSLNSGIIMKGSSPSLEALLGILNSSVTKLYIETISPKLWSGYSYSAKKIESLPIPLFNNETLSCYMAIETRVKKILNSKKEGLEKTVYQNKLENEIDKIVKNLYGMKVNNFSFCNDIIMQKASNDK